MNREGARRGVKSTYANECMENFSIAKIDIYSDLFWVRNLGLSWLLVSSPATLGIRDMKEAVK